MGDLYLLTWPIAAFASAVSRAVSTPPARAAAPAAAGPVTDRRFVATGCLGAYDIHAVGALFTFAIGGGAMPDEHDGDGRPFLDCTDWLLRGPYREQIDEVRTAGGVRLTLGSQSAGHYPDPPFADYSLIVTAAGRCRAETDFGDGRKVAQLVPGAMVVAPPDTACDYRKYGACRTLALGLPRAQVAALAEQATGRPAADLGPCHRFFHDPLVEALCLRLWDEAVEGNPYGALFADHALTAVVAALLARSGRPPKVPGGSHALSGEPLRRVLAYIADNLGRPFTLADLAAVAHLSEFHFARLFKRATGVPPHRYVIRQRVDRAKSLIRDGRHPLAEVAAAVGFSSQSHLNTHFKRLVGCTPAAFRR